MPDSTPVQFRLTAEDKADIEAIREHFGLPSAAAAVRYAVRQLKASIPTKAIPKKTRKKPE